MGSPPVCTSSSAAARSTGIPSTSSGTLDGMRRPANWLQLVRFSVVGASGYAVNLLLYALLPAVGLATHAEAIAHGAAVFAPWVLGATM